MTLSHQVAQARYKVCRAFVACDPGSQRFNRRLHKPWRFNEGFGEPPRFYLPRLAGTMPAYGGRPSGFALHCRSFCHGTTSTVTEPAAVASSRNKRCGTAPSAGAGAAAPGKAEVHIANWCVFPENARIRACRSINPRPSGGRDGIISAVGLAEWDKCGHMALRGSAGSCIPAARLYIAVQIIQSR